MDDLLPGGPVFVPPEGPGSDKPGAGRSANDNPHDPYAALRFPGYRRFLIATLMTEIGLAMQSVAVGWELYARTSSAASLGYVGLVQVIPVLVLALPAGQAVDRYRRKQMAILAQLLLALASFGLAAVSAFRGPVSSMYGFLFLAGIGHALSMPARWALLPQLVSEKALNNAITWNSSGWQVAAMTGPALGGLVIGLTGASTSAYLFDGALGLGALGLLLAIQERPNVAATEPVTIESLLAGLRHVRRNDLILATITLDMFAVLLGGATALLPIYARDILDVGPSGLGWLRAAPSIGAFFMAMSLAHRPPMRRAGVSLLLAVAGFGAATVGFGLSRNVYVSFLMLLLTGAFDNISVVVRATLVQVLTPDSMRGRVSAVNSIFIGTSNELGGFESGMTAHWLGPVASVVLGGIGSMIVVIGVAWNWPSVRALGSLDDAGRRFREETAVG